METADSMRRHHLALAERLRQLRTDAGLSGHDMAGLLGSSQSRISRIETARQMPTEEELTAFATATRASKAVQKQLLEDLRNLQDQWSNFKQLQSVGSTNRQSEIGDVEAKTTRFRQFEKNLVPGLLQTPDYTRSLCNLVDTFATDDDIEAAVDVRQERQRVLDVKGKQFNIVLTESALWNRYGSADVMAEQFEHIIKQSEKPNVRISVITRWTPLPTIPLSSFIIFDEALVTVDTSNGELILRHRDDIAQHVEIFEKMRSVAATGRDARQVLKEFYREAT